MPTTMPATVPIDVPPSFGAALVTVADDAVCDVVDADDVDVVVDDMDKAVLLVVRVAVTRDVVGLSLILK